MSLVLPELEYELPSQAPAGDASMEESFSKGFAFSAFFESSQESTLTSAMGNLTFLRPTSPQVHAPAPGSYIGFSWGPMVNAFDGPFDPETTRIENILPTTTRPLVSAAMTPLAQSKLPLPMPSSFKRIADHQPVSAPASLPHGHRAPAVTFETPVRAASLLGVAPTSTIRRTVGGSARKAGTTRMLDEREALKAMGDCVRASARKKIVELSTGRPVVRASGEGRRGSGHRLKLKLDFENVSGESEGDAGHGNASVVPGQSAKRPGLRVFVKERSYSQGGPRQPTARNGSLGSGSWLLGSSIVDGSRHSQAPQTILDAGAESAATDTASEPPSPSPRPGSRRGTTSGVSTPGGSHFTSASGSGSALSKASNRSDSFTPILRVPSAGSISFRNKTSNTDRVDPMGLFRGGEKATSRPVATTLDDDATPRPLGRHSAPGSDRTRLVLPPPVFQEPQFADTSFNPFSGSNTTGRNRSRNQSESQIQHIRTEEVIDLANSEEEIDSPEDIQDECVEEIAELEKNSTKQIDALEERLAKMTEDIRLIEEGLQTVGNRIGRALKT